MAFCAEHYHVSWAGENRVRICAAFPGENRIFYSAFADGFSDDNELPAFTDETEVDNAYGARRCYFHLFSQAGYGVAAPRVLVDDRATNLRDLGGYNTADGARFVRYGTLYRSCSPYDFSDVKRELLEGLGLRAMIDLRTAAEADAHPYSPVAGARYYNLSPMVVQDAQHFAATMDAFKEMGPARAKVAFFDVLESYRTLMFGSAAYREIFEMLLDTENLPLLYHCAAGKDRTGILSALILAALDVPRETIVADYMLTNPARSEKNRRFAQRLLEELGGGEELERGIGLFVGVEEDSIRSTFAAIDEKYPSIEKYFEKELGLTAAGIQKMKDLFLLRH